MTNEEKFQYFVYLMSDQLHDVHGDCCKYFFILFIIIFIPIDSYTGREIDYVSK